MEYWHMGERAFVARQSGCICKPVYIGLILRVRIKPTKFMKPICRFIGKLACPFEFVVLYSPFAHAPWLAIFGDYGHTHMPQRGAKLVT